MAECLRFRCGNCDKKIDTWSDGNPYYLDEKGKKQYAYHPSAEFELCTGNDSDFICLGCGKKFKSDSNGENEQCPRCSSHETSDMFELDGETCPKCKEGKFSIDPEFHAIS